MHFTAALVPLFALAGSLVEAAPVASTTAPSRGTFRDRQSAYQASVSSSSSAAAAAAPSSSSKVCYVAPTTTTTSQRPSRSTFKERQSAYEASVSSASSASAASAASIASASSASVSSAIAAVTTAYLFPPAAPGDGRIYHNATLYVQDRWFGFRECAADNKYLVAPRALNRTIRISPAAFDRAMPQGRPRIVDPCGYQLWVRNPANPSRGAYFAIDGIINVPDSLTSPTDTLTLPREVLGKVFGFGGAGLGHFQVEWTVTDTPDLMGFREGFASLSRASASFAATATGA
ncbi:hypothetical protein JCM6882_004553 [Rhodosporidiobolus microsporus]